MVQRTLKLSKTQSFFLFGARGTGKSSLLEATPHLAAAPLIIDFLVSDVEEKYILNPMALFEEASLLPKNSWIVIDEVQKVPKILDVIHLCIEKLKMKFALSGSSARKLKRGAANLLGGRAISFSLFPLTVQELGSHFNLIHALNWGTLPGLLVLEDNLEKSRYLKSYVQNYIKEEIQLEQLVRNLDAFRLFLPLAAQSNAEIVNFSNISKQTGSDHKTIQNYFQILIDTKMGFYLEAFDRSVREVQSKSPKFYFFDGGVKRAIETKLTIPLNDGSSEFGREFEAFFINECHRLNLYLEKDYKLSYLRTKDDAEIDLIIETPRKSLFLIEIKSTKQVLDSHLKHLKSFKSSFKKSTCICACQEKTPRLVDGIEVLPWQDAIEKIFY
jgi:predicted AAA+ superfamily ATPase